MISPELAYHITSISRELARQVGVLLGRDGAVYSVIVGDATRIVLPEVGRLRGGSGRFRSLRLIHTHLRGEGLTRDDLNDLALLRLDLVAMIEAGEDGRPGRIEIAQITPVRDQSGEADPPFRVIASRDLHHLNFDFLTEIRELESQFAGRSGIRPGETVRERALVLGLSPDPSCFQEVVELAGSAGAAVVAVMPQKPGRIHARTVVGRGKLQEIVLEGMRRRADLAVFDIDLKPAQARNFEDTTGLKAVDRTQLILDIFAQRAQSRDGKLQVELAQLKYSLPRLTEKDTGLSRLSGGIGGRGPGETVLEIGRRRIRQRLRTLEGQIARLSRQRNVRRKSRVRQGLPVLSIVGYTNAGKTTLLNSLTESRIDAADQMFVTLDPTSRRLRFPRGGNVIVTDTVGFIRNLPPDLRAAFRTTLEELRDADLLLHVIDASDPQIEPKRAVVAGLLEELGLGDIPRLYVLNKADRIEPSEVELLCRRYDCIAVSALKRTGLDRLLQAVGERLGQGENSPI